MSGDYRALSFWLESLADEQGENLTPRPGLKRDRRVDVCIVGGGLTGLWTAYYLAKADPSLSILVLEKEIAGFGASGRNGGWCSALFPRSAGALERAYGADAAAAVRRAMVATVDEVGRVVREEDIACDFAKGGTLSFARDAVQLEAARAEVAAAERLGVDRLQLIEDATALARYGVGGGAVAAVLDPACARVQPATLVRGLARVVESLGVQIYEGTQVTAWGAHRARFVSGRDGESVEGVVAAANVVIAVEGFGADLPGVGRHIMPLYSLMIATEPLPSETWERIGIRQGQTFGDYRHLLVYGQRTADDRIAFGGRGARYHWGSRIRPEYDTSERVLEHLRRALVDLFPAVEGAEVTHHWGGPLGVPRDWHPSASYNPRTGVAFAGGYVGDGLSTTNLAGRTLRDLLLGIRSELTALPWVNHRSPKWEPEPLRFLGANLGLAGMGIADVEERMLARPSLAARLIAPLTGH
ncbi:FAD-dependent oxidoreductase [Rathayibacter sp. YIM 133350]|uniref:NAD(P)/FAD-dependent oxidoreductase n=1 Tax=Rathayibacter sp. YIM 133350 TaxID=3131992 RepID=UPI00307E1458